MIKKELDLKKIKVILKEKGITINAFAEELGITNIGLHKIMRENTTTEKQLKNISKKLNVPIETFYSDGVAKSEPNNSVGVPLLPVEAIAGFPTSDIGGVNYADCEQYTVPEFAKSGCEFVVKVSGSSMYPKYSNGDILACKKIHDILFFQWGKVYVIDSSQGVLVKRVFEDTENPDNIILASDNKENYPPFPMPKSDIRSLSIVLGVIRME